MLPLQQWLSGYCNLLFRDPKVPERLCPWGQLALVGGGLVALVVVVQLA